MSKALTGKWILNDKIYPLYAGDMGMIHYVWFNDGFTSNGQRFKAIRFAENALKYETESGLVEAGAGYHEDDYATPFEQYRVIDFGTGSEANDDSDGTFVAWFLDNVTRYGTVADKLVQIAKNEKAVYQSGYDKALEKGGYDQGFEDGKDAEYDAFWDVYQQGGNRKEYHNSFGMGWTGEIFRPKYNIAVSGGAYAMFQNFGFGLGVNLKQCLIDAGVTLTFPKCYNISSLFSSAGITEIGELDLSTVTRKDCTNIFAECSMLKTIDKLILPIGQTNFGSWFYNCKALEDITIEGEIGANIAFQHSTKLTRASIESIVNHLSDNVSGKTLTLSKTAADNAFPCPMEDGNGGWINVGCGGNGEWIELVATKSNWQISLV